MADYDAALYMSPLYKCWQNMKTRCTNKKSADFKRYGGRGITVCDEWLRFAGFLKDMGASYTPGLTLERRNNALGYSKTNCEWVTRQHQANNRRSNKKIAIGSEVKNLEQWIRHFNLKSSTVRQRIYCYGWPVERALTGV